MKDWKEYLNCCMLDATEKKVIAVIGATGQQGGGLVKAILDDPRGGFAVRALTRDPTKDKAVALKNQGAQVVPFDIDDPSTHAKALEGAYGVFVVTNYWEHFSVEKETQQAKSIADAAQTAGVNHIIWSTLEGTTEFFDSLPESERPPRLAGGYYVPHFDAKNEGNAFFPADKTTFLYTTFYLENFASLGMIQDGVMTNNMGDATLAVIAREDIGKCAYGIFKAGDKYKGESVYIAGSCLTCDTLMKIAADVTGREFEYRAVDRDTYASFDFPGADDMANMFDFYAKNKEFAQKRSGKHVKEINPTLMSAREWMEKHEAKLSSLAKPVPEAALPRAEAPVSDDKKEIPEDVDDEIPAEEAPKQASYHGEEIWA